jgi:uncharacterized RDD family membrane protein YckC
VRRDEDINVHNVQQTSGVYPDEQVVTGEAVALDLRLAGVGSRGVAALIDLFITNVALVVFILIFVLSGAGSNGALLATVLVVVVVGCTLGYPVGFETLMRGRTPGKMIMGLRVVRDDGGPIRFRHALVRGLAGLFLEKLGISDGLLALGFMVVGSRKKRIGDLLAGTIVLQERVPGRLETPVAMPPPLAGWAASLDLSAVDDGLAMRIRQFLGRANQLTPEARANLEHQLASEVVAKIGPPPPHTPVWALLSAVLAERRRRSFASLPAPPPPPVWGQPPGTAIPLGAAAPSAPPVPPAPVGELAPPTDDGYVPPA